MIMAQRITLKIDTGNAAFDDAGKPQEVARILRELADRLESRACLPDAVRLFDFNGNHCGDFVSKGKA